MLVAMGDCTLHQHVPNQSRHPAETGKHVSLEMIESCTMRDCTLHH